MKNILKKIGVFGLICAVLSPYVSLPKVNAETTDNCKHYLNSYLFLDITNGSIWDQYVDGYNTYTSFLYTFDASVGADEKLVIDSVGEVPLDTPTKLQGFYDVYDELLSSEKKGSISDYKKFGVSSEQSHSDYESGTYILHGYWAREGEKSNLADWSDLKTNAQREGNRANIYFAEHTIQKVLLDRYGNDGSKKINEILEDTISGAKYNKTLLSQSGKYSSAPGYSTESSMLKFIDEIVQDKLTNEGKKVLESGFISNDDNGNSYINVAISREITKDDLNELNFGYKDESGKYLIYTTDYTAGVDSTNIVDSYQALLNHEADATDGSDNDRSQGKWNTVQKTESDINVYVNTAYYWPVIYNVEYSICKTSNEVEGTWTLNYKEGVENVTEVTNMPSPKTVTYKKGETAIVTEKKPTRSGYAFNGWKLCNGETAYKAKDEIKNTEAGVVVDLCAQWGKEGTEENKKQGVISYVLGFAAVGLVAGTVYLISKKKDLFKQI